ncbi:Monogalactosyldiacylglycerol synthase [Candidatus Promineifilum breve]|uniref:Monogalactosyldiacylglycerol synthase n=1 Tax=Candidatus Promineifilum breve TaxID=1806508 RepID=A0A170PD95_9CHLR|nr:galactosyldiacylglycerol synthase [Candidatus Promineifilum breve]CUS01893.1 Monogalactosyldiacylglycerol synthase [Candidatus Promineifilum breve]
MINLYDTHKQHIGAITEAQLQFLQDSMEEESLEDQDYYLEPATLDYLEARGADGELLALLRGALGEHDGLTVRWNRSE